MEVVSDNERPRHSDNGIRFRKRSARRRGGEAELAAMRDGAEMNAAKMRG